jgi:hypothetical protein
MWEHVRFGALLALAAAAEPGCVLETYEQEEDVGETDDALDSHDGNNPRMMIDEKCEEVCRQLLHACIDACKTQQPKDRATCVGSCSAAYGECARDCGYGGGCRRPWWGWEKQ